MYLSFYSDVLDPNQITDYLTRVVQPKLTAINGVQSADILGARTFAMRVWLKPDRMAALNISPTDVRNALAANNYLSALGATKGSMISVNLVANTDLRTRRRIQATSSSARTATRSSGLQDVANVDLGAEDYDTDVRFDGQQRDVHGHLGAADLQLARCHPRGAQAAARHRKAAARRHEASACRTTRPNTSRTPSTR